MRRIALLLLLCALPAHAAQRAISLLWDRNPEVEVIGYRVYSGFSTRSYETVKDAGNEPGAYTIATLGRTNFFAVTAYDVSGLESGFSNEVTYYDGDPIQFYLGLLPPKTVTVTNQFVVTPSNTNHVRSVVVPLEVRSAINGSVTTFWFVQAEGQSQFFTAPPGAYLTNAAPQPFIMVQSKPRSNVSIMPGIISANATVPVSRYMPARASKGAKVGSNARK